VTRSVTTTGARGHLFQRAGSCDVSQRGLSDRFSGRDEHREIHLRRDVLHFGDILVGKGQVAGEQRRDISGLKWSKKTRHPSTV